MLLSEALLEALKAPVVRSCRSHEMAGENDATTAWSDACSSNVHNSTRWRRSEPACYFRHEWRDGTAPVTVEVSSTNVNFCEDHETGTRGDLSHEGNFGANSWDAERLILQKSCKNVLVAQLNVCHLVSALYI